MWGGAGGKCQEVDQREGRGREEGREVDLLDRALSDLRPVIRGKKWHWQLIVNTTNISFVYCWRIYRIISGEILSQKEFRRRVVSIMIRRYASQIMDVRSRPASTFKVGMKYV